MIKEVKYKLKNSLEYTNGGEKLFAKEITLRSPTRAVLAEASFIQGQVLKNGLEASKLITQNKTENKENSDSKMTANSYISILYFGEAEKSFEAFDKILLADKNGLKFALIDDKTSFTDLLISRLSKEDYEGMLGAYIESFLSQSLAK